MLYSQLLLEVRKEIIDLAVILVLLQAGYDREGKRREGRLQATIKTTCVIFYTPNNTIHTGRTKALLASTHSVWIRRSAVVDLKLNVRHKLHCTLVVLDGCNGKKYTV